MDLKEKELLLADLSARLPYGVKVFIQDNTGKYSTITEKILDTYVLRFINNNNILIKPYLRPMSSMTKEERDKLGIINCMYVSSHDYGVFYQSQDFLNSIHVDYRCLIEKGLALEAPEGMYGI